MFPAPAGINRARDKLKISDISVPRASGDKPCALNLINGAPQCSPRQRG
ncbi:hypothetical protein CIT292_09835 [Citrobacter youngae ATCC 29220]|uniref:Uncharacterized protein n=1 Tax=Citrobacter youngae ATCC 29220 TaxID=500640 RepID=D4BH28_9ENTR|nr:hypothetical protein CIT292_09835 [Citrobacter youngae ATCC 29220]